jgi:hypothetical protein
MPWGQGQPKPRGCLQPGVDVLARMRAGVITDEGPRLDPGWNQGVQGLQARHTLPLALAGVARPIDAPRARVERGEEGEGPSPSIFLCHLMRAAGLGRPCAVARRAWLPGGLFIETQAHVIGPQQPRIQRNHLGHPRLERRVSRHGGGQPQVGPPGCQVMGLKEAAPRFGRKALAKPVPFQLGGQLDAVPLGEGPAQAVGPLTGQFDQRHGDRGGKRPAGGRGRGYPRGRPCAC